MPTAEVTLEEEVLIGEEVFLPAPGVRVSGVAPYSGVATVDGVVQPSAAFNVDYDIEEIVVKNNYPVPWPKGAILQVSWEDAVAGEGGGEGIYLPLTGGIMTGPIGIDRQWTLNSTSGGFFINFDYLINQAGINFSPSQIRYEGFPAFNYYVNYFVDNNCFVRLNTYRRSAVGGSLLRWTIYFGDSSPETGNNTGCDFSIAAFSDTATVEDTGADSLEAPLSTPIHISRATGVMTLSTAPIINNLINALDDVAAAAAGVPVSGMYRNGSVLMVRVV